MSDVPVTTPTISSEKVTRLYESAFAYQLTRTCVAELTARFKTEFQGPGSAEFWELIGVSLAGAVNLHCDPDHDVVADYWKLRRELEAQGKTEALGRFHQHIDGIWVYLRSGFTDDSGFTGAGEYRIDRNDTDFTLSSLNWLTIAGLHAYSLGPSGKAALEADAREQALARLYEISAALRTSHYFSGNREKLRGSSTTYACMLDLVRTSRGPVMYLKPGGYDDFLSWYSFDELMKSKTWKELYDDVAYNSLGFVTVAGNQMFGDILFQNEILANHGTDIRAGIETAAVAWLDSEGEIDYEAVKRTMDSIYVEFEKLADDVGRMAPVAASDVGQALEPVAIVSRAIAILSDDPSSVYSCRLR